ncbi:type II secretion system F family protein [Photobacterium aphoticum]|uniref:Biotin synthase n=1 Tax=Photobacterium aphoticum TaxID=754436 RepID=A0A090QM20_9GAMM|nr:type II secretion system F family protein [Photobacterium aphoticum]KLU98440.1 biotin synthase [Photobacterium aphoticum]PSU57381.1 type II secretion system F family protein [Photobacterium aphoticum]GAL03956.1 type II/IV secretion system protein TadC [Photobacterium aphoticum]GHA63727.1 biotin synthase [Photobacterium aphoticum]
MALVISGLLFGVVIALLITNYYQEKMVKANINAYLLHERKSRLSRLNDFIVRFGKEHRQDLEQKFVDAGIYNTHLAKYYFPIKMSVVAVFIGSLFISEMEQNTKIVLGLIGFIVILLAPDMILASRKKMLVGRMSRQLPYMLDMMSVCVQTGMTIEAALTYLGVELETFDKDLCYQIRKTSDGARLHGLEKALYDLSLRIPTAEVRSFTLTLIQNLQYGTSIANVLSDLAEDMRKIQVLSIEEKIGKLSAKMSIPLILLIMFPIVVLILAPGIMQMSINIG